MGCQGKPFCVFTSLAVVLNLPQVFLGLHFLKEIPCRATTWLLINVPLCIANIVAAYYLSSSVMNPNSNLEQFPTPKSRASRLLCKDGCFATYVVVLLASVAFSIVGNMWVTGGTAKEGDKCSDAIVSSMYSAVILNFCFYAVGLISFAMTMCCVCCSSSNHEEQLPLIAPPKPIIEEEVKSKEVPEPVIEEVVTAEAAEATLEQPEKATEVIPGNPVKTTETTEATLETSVEAGSAAVYGATTTTEPETVIEAETKTATTTTKKEETAPPVPRNGFVRSFVKVKDYFESLKPPPKIHYHS